MTRPAFTQHLSVSITPDMDRFLEELARSRTRQSNKPVSKAQLIREAIRLYLDQQVDLHGSRKQIARSMEGKLALLANEMAGLTHQVALLNQQAQGQQQTLQRLHVALQPLLTWVESRRPQASR